MLWIALSPSTTGTGTRTATRRGQDDDDDEDDDEECDIETSGDLTLSKRHDEPWRREGVVLQRLDDLVGCTVSPGDCWAMCEYEYGDGVVAID